MKTRVMDSPAKRISIAVALVTGLILVVALGFTFFGGHTEPINAPKILAAAQAYTKDLRLRRVPVPSSIPLQELIDKGFLQAKDAGSLVGMDAAISLTVQNYHPETPLILVHTKDGHDLVLRADGGTMDIKP
jgi:hypothetical protein